jgi:hypothetical protein
MDFQVIEQKLRLVAIRKMQKCPPRSIQENGDIPEKMVFDDEHGHRFNEQRRKGGRGGRRTGAHAKKQRRKGKQGWANVGYVKRSLSIDSARGIKSTAMFILETP